MAEQGVSVRAPVPGTHRPALPWPGTPSWEHPERSSWAAEVGPQGPPGCSVQGDTPEGAPATSREEQSDPHCLGLPRDGAVPVVRAAWGVELSGVM